MHMKISDRTTDATGCPFSCYDKFTSGEVREVLDRTVAVFARCNACLQMASTAGSDLFHSCPHPCILLGCNKICVCCYFRVGITYMTALTCCNVAKH